MFFYHHSSVLCSQVSDGYLRKVGMMHDSLFDNWCKMNQLRRSSLLRSPTQLVSCYFVALIID